jgi:hypothetical protein
LGVYFNTHSKDNTLKAQNRIIEICKCLSTDTYINPQGGKELYNENDFLANGIKLHFIKSRNIEYKQFHSPFIPNLSILVVLMLNSVEKINKMLDQYELPPPPP